MITINRIIEGIHVEVRKLYTKILKFLEEVNLNKNDIYKIFKNLRNSKQDIKFPNLKAKIKAIESYKKLHPDWAENPKYVLSIIEEIPDRTLRYHIEKKSVKEAIHILFVTAEDHKARGFDKGASLMYTKIEDLFEKYEGRYDLKGSRKELEKRSAGIKQYF